jgi:uncharacterized membrane protein
LALGYPFKSFFGPRETKIATQLRFDAAPSAARVLKYDGGFKMAMPLEMSSRVAGVLCAVVMIAVIVGVDFAFFRNRFWERLIANIGIVLVFAAFYLRFLRHP